MTIFLKQGKTYKVTSEESLDVRKRLPVGTYTINEDKHGQLFLQEIGEFEVKGKLYGNTSKNADRILKTFNDREVSTGVLLTGEKGSGKTMLAKYISILASVQDIPTIVINSCLYGESFNLFLQMIEQPTIVIFDEFEKVYCLSKQEKLLTLLDGVYPSKKLFIFTCNYKERIDENMLNRPGRIYYKLEFNGFDQDFIREYCVDNLKNQDHVSMVCTVARAFAHFNFDMMKALIEEMNRFNETPADALKFLNVYPDVSPMSTFTIEKIIVDGKVLEKKLIKPTWRGRPLEDKITIPYSPTEKDEKKNENMKFVHFLARDLKLLDDRSGSYTFSTNEGKNMVVLKPKHSRFGLNFEFLQTVKHSSSME